MKGQNECLVCSIHAVNLYVVWKCWILSHEFLDRGYMSTWFMIIKST